MMLVGKIMALIEENDETTFRHNVDSQTDAEVLAQLMNCAASNNQVWAIDYLISAGADANGRYGRFKANAITTAAFHNSLEAAKRLVFHGGRIEDASSLQSPMMKAVSQGHLEMVRWLIDVGCDPHLTFKLKDGSFRNALTYALYCGSTEVAEYLKTIGVSLPVDHEGSAEDETNAASPQDNSTAQIIGHMQANLGSVNPLSAQEIFSPMAEAAVTVNFGEPDEKYRYRTLFSSGPSNLALPIPDGEEGYEFAEFVLHLPAEWPDPVNADPKWQWPISYFKQIAYMPHLKQKWIGPRNIIAAVDIEPEWPQDSDLTHAMLVPDLVPPLLGDQTIHFYTIVPMTQHAQKLGIEGGTARVVAAIKSGELDIAAAWRPFL